MVTPRDASAGKRSMFNEGLYPSEKNQSPPPDYVEPASKKKTYSDVVQEFSDNTTAHGIPRIINARQSLAKFLWFIVVAGSTGVFVWQSLVLVFDFFDWPVDVSIEVITKSDGVEYPAVTVCNINRLRRSEMEGTRFEGILDIDGGGDSNIWDYDGFEWYFYSDRFSDSDSATDEPSTEASVISGRRRRSLERGYGNEEPSFDEFHPGEDISSDNDFSIPLKNPDSVNPNSEEKNSNKHGHWKRRKTDTGTKQSKSGPSKNDRDYPDFPDYETDQKLHGQVHSRTQENDEATRQRRPIDRKKFSDVMKKLMEPEVERFKQRRQEDVETRKARMKDLKKVKHERKLNREKRFASYGGSAGMNYEDSWMNEFQWDDMGDLGMSDWEYYDYGWDGVTGDDDWDGFYANSKMEDFSDLADVANPTDDEFREIGHQAKDFILQCTFDKRPCNYTHFYQWQNKNYGNCFTFNSGINEAVRQTGKSGSQYGLHLTLFIEQPEYVGLFSQESGVRVSVSPQDVMPFPEDIGITVSPGQATSIGLRKNDISRQGGNYGNCTSGDEYYIVNTEFKYSVNLCVKECLQKNLIERCSCVTDILLDEDKCSYVNTTQQRCRQIVQGLFEDYELNCTCKNPCEETSYSTMVSSSIWPSERYESHLYGVLSEKSIKAAITLQDVDASRLNLVRLKVFFEELNFQSIVQTPKYNMASLLSSIGGTLGLYIGLSIITIMEIIVFLCHSCIFCCRKITGRGSVHP
ncbi:uncharacterized protein LOC144435805 [Glandiceps talaboti]